VRLASSARVVAATAINIALYAASRGRFLWLEGRVQGGVFRNWVRGYRYAPRQFARPTSEAAIVELVKTAGRLRVLGAGHSFNEGVVSEEVLVSLDEYRGLVARDRERRQVTVKSGTRVREVVNLLAEDGLAFAALPSHDAQSIGGILSTDVHGTGRRWGFVSESVVALTLVDGRGDVHRCYPSDDLFRAAVGGIGAVGIITEVTIQGVPRFNVSQKTEIMEVDYVKANLNKLLGDNEHLSLYLYPFSDTCQVNTWNRTEDDQTPHGDLREFGSTALDAALAAGLGSVLAYSGLLRLSRVIARLPFVVRRGSNLVMESHKAFNRSIYHLHQELEFTVAFDQVWAACDGFVKSYEDLYRHDLPYTVVEVRFTPEGHQRTLIGAGRARRSAWIDLICNDSDGFQRYYRSAMQLMTEINARPHLGKFCDGLTKQDLERVHGEHLQMFLDLVAERDPHGKFSNDFTRRLFGTPAQSAGEAHRSSPRQGTST
jgi:D-arabinono-1,4-lactone oxidase/FAD binding domain